MSELTDPPLTIPAGTQVVAREGVRDEKEHKRAGALPPAPQPDSLRPSIIYRCVVGTLSLARRLAELELAVEAGALTPAQVAERDELLGRIGG
ncbi:hypothetical protein K2Z83_12895 [Oscillochloris sp. ZM17-4]|uniref:hypothetical protein n=1 Tax=Oscillochloris sp. ZM17-4 TaxID=2866714 RepID=UPI001C73563E|nr:hypothetical protein [Oscillochloris sp. ZM17-4]MBX0328575.1 hypothetical protein [Oscillochloris sp. ZM17-4]